MKRATTAELRRLNKRAIYQLIYEEQKISKQEISSRLNMSLPTVSQNLQELEQEGFIHINGFFQSTGGRKAQAYCCVEDARYAIGVEISKRFLQVVATDIYGNVMKSYEESVVFEDSEQYFQKIGKHVETIVEELGHPKENLLGVGIALQGLISADGTTLIYGIILECTGLTIDRFEKYIPYPCMFIHDALAAATAEIWHAENITDAIFIHMGHNIGGAVIIDGKVHEGQALRSGVLEHITLIPDGKPCYCGKKGCVEAYCGLDRLLTDGETLKEFFAKLREGEPERGARYDEYLGYLSLAIDNFHMLLDCDIILGGKAAAYLIQDDVTKLQRMVEERTAFTDEDGYIRLSRHTEAAIAIGAAIPWIAKFLETII